MSVKVLFIELSDTADSQEKSLMQLVSAEKREKLKIFHCSINLRLSIYAEGLVRKKAIETLGVRNEEIIFITNEYGKPYLNGYPSFHFNISHAHSAIAVAFSNDEVGIDIELVREADFKIAKRFFTINEAEYIRNSSNPTKAFYEIWTKKEAYIKYRGMGLSLSLKSFCVLDKAIKELIRTVELNGYIISVCNKEVTHKLIY